MEARQLLRFLSEHTVTPKQWRSPAAGGPLDYLAVTLRCSACGVTKEIALRDCMGLTPTCACGAHYLGEGVEELLSRLTAIEALGAVSSSASSARVKPGVLLVEDDAASELLTVRVIERCEVACQVHVARDGRQALDFLADTSRPRIDLVLLDVCMPILDGFGVLRHFRGDETLRRIPVVMLSTTTEASAVDEAFALGAAGYVAKGGSLGKFREDITATLRYWLLTSLRPQVDAVQPNYLADL